GYTVLRRAVYEVAAATMLPPAAAHALRGDRLRSALFFSADTARTFVRLLTDPGLRTAIDAVEACAIGPAAGVALSALSWRRIRVARRPNHHEMLALLQ
ncbi:MAG: uroporphyrinogen-III synthase, partial [Acetobacteraceae bacterium]